MSRSQRAMKNLLLKPLFLPIVFLALVGLAPAQESDEEFKVVGIDVQRVFQEFYKTKQTENRITEARIGIHKADRKLRAQVKMATKEIEDEKNEVKGVELNEVEQANYDRKIARMTLDRDRLNAERVSLYRKSDGQLNQDMMTTMKGLLGEIHRFIKAHAEETGYDMVLDTSGTTTNQTSPVLGGKGIRDITATVIAELNRDNPDLKEKE